VTGTVTPANPRPARWLDAVGCPRPVLLRSDAERFDMSGYAKQHRLAGRSRVPR
jgi:hypothetical protein